ncbi:MAG: hypothetical protein AAGF24_10520 [Cyanobacteria bacterium P01_H01_bin.121]
MSKLISDAWLGVWQTMLGTNPLVDHPSPLYSVLVHIARGLAVMCLLVFLVQWGRALMEDNTFRSLNEIIWPLLVILLLSNEGAILRELSVGVHNVINSTNNDVIAAVNKLSNFETDLGEITSYPAAKDEINSILKQCDLAPNLETKKQCVVNAEQEINIIIAAYKKTNPQGKWVKNLQQYAQDALQSLKNSLNHADGKNWGLSALNLGSDALLKVMELFFAAFQTAFQYIMEAAFILTAMMAPIFVSVTLLPVGAKAIYTWLTAMFSIGMFKLCLNVIMALCIQVTYSFGPSMHLTNVVLLGLLSPILAFALAAGGGMSIFKSFISGGNAALVASNNFMKTLHRR